MNIPKKIHQTWYKKKLPEKIQEQVNKIKSINNNYEYKFYDDNDILKYIETYYDEKTLDTYKKLTIGASKADLFRYLVLYNEGGVYLDLDSNITKNLDDLIKNYSGVISRENHRPFFLQWMMCFSKGHPILKKIIDLSCKNINSGNYKDINLMTGPKGPYTKGINDVIQIENLWDLEDYEINKKLQENDNEYLKNTVFYDTDYKDYAEFKSKDNIYIYLDNPFKLHWKQRQYIENNKYSIILITLLLILLPTIYYLKF